MKSIAENLNLSILELLSVLLPGATGLFFLNKIAFIHDLFLQEFPMKDEWMKGLVYFGAAYFIGYVIYVSSSFLDSWYDKIKRKGLRLDLNDDKRMDLEFLPPEYRKEISPILRLLFPYLIDTHNLTVKVIGFKNKVLDITFDGDKHQIINAYQYAFRRLMVEQPRMFAEVERYYGTARFFRSMTITLFLGAFTFLLPSLNWGNFCSTLLLSIISLFTFFNSWRKANHVAFKNIIILESTKINKVLPK